MYDYEKLTQEITVLKAQLVEAELYINELKGTIEAIQALVEPPTDYDNSVVEEEDNEDQFNEYDYDCWDCE